MKERSGAPRIIDYRNSFLPVIKGKIQTDANGLTIDVKMQLHPVATAFLIYWAYFWGRFCIYLPLMDSNELNPEVLMPYGLLLSVYALTMGACKFETSRSRKDLETLFEGQVLE
jgi:hypothetical protein